MMQVPGHCRCVIDAGFAHIKRKYKRSDCNCIGDLANVVNNSAVSNSAVLFHEEDEWVWRNWKAFLELNFKPVPGIRKYQQFRFHHDFPGVVFVKKNNESDEVSLSILKGNTVVSRTRPDIMLPAGQSLERRRYLFDNVRKYVSAEHQDTTCPRYDTEE